MALSPAALAKARQVGEQLARDFPPTEEEGALMRLIWQPDVEAEARAS